MSTRLPRAASELTIAFDLPWPWGGEPFELRDIRPLTHIVGPLGSGKTRLAKRIAEVVPGAVFLGVDRLTDGRRAIEERLSWFRVASRREGRGGSVSRIVRRIASRPDFASASESNGGWPVSSSYSSTPSA